VSEREATTSQQQRLELNVTSDPANLAAVRKEIETFASARGFDERAVAEIGLCVNEAMANVIRHAYRGRHDRPIRVAASLEDAGESIVVTMRDWGSGIDPSCLPRRPRDPLRPGGIGLICLGQWMDEVAYAPQPDGGVLATMKRRRSR
jgi:serine/threonine-protein kinase RsbW